MEHHVGIDVSLELSTLGVLDAPGEVVREQADANQAMDLEQTLRGLLRGFRFKVGDVSCGTLAERIRALASGHATLERIGKPMLTEREALWSEFAKLHREVLAIVKEDQVCRRLVRVPGFGAVMSLIYRAGVDQFSVLKRWAVDVAT